MGTYGEEEEEKGVRVAGICRGRKEETRLEECTWYMKMCSLKDTSCELKMVCDVKPNSV